MTAIEVLPGNDTDEAFRPRALVADDHGPTRRLVAEALEADGFEICAVVEDADRAFAAAVQHRPEVCILDVSMPGGGISAARAISERLPGTTVVMHTISEEHEDLLGALRAGADGYLLKSTDPGTIGRVLRAVMAGETAIPRHLTARLIEDYRAGRPKRVTSATGQPVALSPREWEVLDLLRAGLSTADIAARSYVAPVTVRSHVSSLLRKLRVATREEAVELVFGS
jgi:two-component system, NarL family, nitrate/nitrite response regulator NarL